LWAATEASKAEVGKGLERNEDENDPSSVVDHVANHEGPNGADPDGLAHSGEVVERFAELRVYAQSVIDGLDRLQNFATDSPGYGPQVAQFLRAPSE
jgi:hypothetical protein